MPFEGTPKEAATHLLQEANKQRVQFPKLMDDAKRMQVCGATVMLHRVEGAFNIDEAIQDLIEKYGQAPEEEKASKTTKKKRKSDAADAEEDDDGEEKEATKKVRKTEQIANESNRPLAEAIKEIADINFKQKEMRTGGVFSKAAKAIRECETAITSGKEAMKLKGIGKGIAGYIDEFLTTGSINKLEELRASM